MTTKEDLERSVSAPPAISVIVPVYNAEKYLHRCIDSILSQTFTDFELLLIDDGSKDKSGAICDEYAVKDSRVRVFHKENGGVSSARNLGLDNAEGEYIAFVDADDWIEATFLECMYPYDDFFDLVCAYYKAHGWKGWIAKPYDNCSFDKNTLPLFFEQHLISCNTVWCKLFKRQLIWDYRVKFDLAYSYGEDTLFVLDYLYCVDSVCTIDNDGYNYCVNACSDGLSAKPVDLDKYTCLIDSLSTRIDTLSEKYPWNSYRVKMEILRLSCNRVFKEMDYNENNASELLSEFCQNKNVADVIRCKIIPKSIIKRFFYYMLCLKLYSLVTYMMCHLKHK